MGVFAKAFATGVRPIKTLSVSEFAEEFIYNPPSTADPGKFTLSRAPYQKAIMDALTPNNGINEVALQAGAQIGKTFIANVWQGHIFYINPQNFIAYQPTIKLAEVYSEQKITPLIECTPVLNEMFGKGKGVNNIQSKKFKGCTAEYKGANSGNSFRMISAPYIFADEIDSYDADIDGEGSPLKLLKARTTTFGKKAKIFYSSTPTIKDASAIESKFLEGDQNYYHVPCPNCKAKQVLQFPNLRFERKETPDGLKLIPESIYYECQICKGQIKEDKKTYMLLNGEWIPENPNAPKHIKSFHINSLYSPLGWYSWESLITDFLDAKDDQFALKAFKNTRLGETYYEKAEQPSHHKLKARAEQYELYTVNEKAVTLFAGCDVQDNRIAVLVIAFGEALEAWVVAYEEINGNPSDSEVWERVERVLRRPYIHKSGVELHVKAAAVDSGGHFTNNVYDFVRRNQDKFYAVKGASHDINTYVKESAKIDIDPRTGKKFNNPLSLYLVNTMLLKKWIYIALNNMLANDKEDGSSVIHFSKELHNSFFEMLVSEKLIKKVIKGTIKEEFIKPKGSTRNEVLDCFVYALAMAFMHQIQNLYGSEYKKVWELNINKKIESLEKKEENKKKVKPVKKGWINKSGFSIK